VNPAVEAEIEMGEEKYRILLSPIHHAVLETSPP
jgi:hypothetical protein